MSSSSSSSSDSITITTTTTTTTISNAFSSFLLSKFTLHREEGEGGTNSLETLLLILFTILLSFFPTLFAIRRWIFPSLLQLGLQFVARKGVRVTVGSVGFLSAKDVILNFSSPQKGGNGTIEQISIGEIRYTGRFRQFVNWLLKTLYSSSSVTESTTTTTTKEGGVPEEWDGDASTSKEVVTQNSNRMMNVPIRCFDVQVKKWSARKIKKKQDYEDNLDGDYVEEEEEEENEEEKEEEEEKASYNNSNNSNSNNNETDTASKRIRENFKKRVVARFLSLLEINLVDLRVYDEDVFTVTTTQMVLTTKPVADALKVFVNMPSGVRIIPKSVRVGKKDNAAIAISKVFCSAMADLEKIGRVSDVQVKLFGIDPVFTDDSQDLFNHAWIESIQLHQVRGDSMTKDDLAMDSSFALGYEIKNVRSEGFCFQNSLADARVQDQLDSSTLNERVKSSVLLTVPEISGIIQTRKNNQRKVSSKVNSRSNRMDVDGGNINTTVSMKMSGASLDFQDDCSLKTYSRKVEIDMLEIEHHSCSYRTVQPTTKITMDAVQLDWDPDAHFLFETLSEDTKKFLASLAFLKMKEDHTKQQKEKKVSQHRNVSLDATNVSFGADLTLGANVRLASTRVHLEENSTMHFENFEIETNAETFFTTKSLALEKRKHDSGWDITTSAAVVKCARDLDFGDFYAALFAGESAFKQALKKFTSTSTSTSTNDKFKLISKKVSSKENDTVLNLPDSTREVHWISTGGNTFIIEDSEKLESFLRMQEKFLKPELKRSRKILRDADETKDAQMIQQIFENVAKAYKKRVDRFNENKNKDLHFLNLVDNILTVRAETLNWSFKYGCNIDEREKIGHFCRCVDAPYSDGVDLHITRYQTIDWTCEKFDVFLGGEECAMFEAKAISMQGPVVLAKQSVQSNDMHLLPFPVGKRRFAAIRSHQSPTSPSVLVFTNVTQTWIDGKLRYLASSEPKYAILSREISNRMVPKSRHRDAPKGEITLKRVKDTIPWWDNLRNLWRGDFTIIARNSEIVLDSSLKDTKSRHALAFKASKCEISYKSGHILLRAARFAVSKHPSFSNAVSHTIFVAPAVEVGLKYEWLTKDNINGYATSYRFDPTTGMELRTLSDCKSCDGSHKLSVQLACKDTLLPGWRADHILDDNETKISTSIAEESVDEDFVTPTSSRKNTVGNFQTPLSSFDSTTNTNSIETSSSPPLVKWRSDDFKTQVSALKSSPSRMASVLISPSRGRNKSDLHSVLNSFDGTSMDSEFTETPYFRFTTEDMRYMKKWWRALMKPDLVSLRNAWRYKQYGKTKVEVAGKSYGKTEKMKTKSMVSVLYSKQPSWEMTAEYLNYSLPTKEKDETFQSIAAFLEGFSYISNANENLNVHAKDLRIFLPEKEEKEAVSEPNQISSANFNEKIREMLRGSNNHPLSPRKFRAGDVNGANGAVNASSRRAIVTDSMLVLETREFRVRKASAKDEVRVNVDAPRALLESKTREKVFTWIREMWQASLGDDTSIEKSPSMFELEKLGKSPDMDFDQYNKHRKNVSVTSGFSESSQSNAKTANSELDLLELINAGIEINDENVVSEPKISPSDQVITDECLFVVQISEPQINLRGDSRNGRLLLAAENGLVVGRRIVSSSSDRSSVAQKQRLVEVSLHDVAAYVAPTDIDLRAGVQWLEDKYSDEEVMNLQLKRSSLLRQIFAPCEMIFKHSAQTGDNGGSDDSDAPTKFSFRSPDIDATMESEQQAVLVDVIGALFLTPSNFTSPSPNYNAIALLRKKGQRSLFDQEDAAASAIVAAPLLEYIKSVHALRLYDIDFQKCTEDDASEVMELKEDEDVKRQAYLDVMKRKEKALAKSIRRAESLTKYNRKRAAMEMHLEIERGAWALRKAGKTFMNAEITNLILSRERHVDSSGVTLFKLKGLHLQTVEKVILGRWLLDEDWNNVPAALRTKPNFLQVSAYRAASPPEAPIWNHLEVLLSPFKIDITKEIYQMIYDYAFPSEREIKSKKMHLAFEKEFQTSKATATTTATTTKTATTPATGHSNKVDKGSSIKMAKVGDGKEDCDDGSDDDDEDTMSTSGPKVVQVKYLRFNESKVKVSYHGSAGSFKDVRLLLDSYTCESFEGKWRELVGQLKGNLAWSALKSVTGFAGRKLNKIKSVANEDVAGVPVAATAETGNEEGNVRDNNDATPVAYASTQTDLMTSPTKKKSLFKKLFRTPTKNEKNERDVFMSGFTATNPADK